MGRSFFNTKKAKYRKSVIDLLIVIHDLVYEETI